MSVVALLVVLASAPAAFEGLVVQELAYEPSSAPSAEARKAPEKGEQLGGKMKTWIRRDGAVRTEFNVQAGGLGLRIDGLTLPGDKHVTLILHDTNTFYESTGDRGLLTDKRWRVKKLGRKKILGYPVEHIQLTSEGDDVVHEFWLSQIVDGSVALADTWSSGPYTYALKKAGVPWGYPLRYDVQTRAGMKVHLKTVSIKRREVPADKMRIPKGYKRTSRADPISILGLTAPGKGQANPFAAGPLGSTSPARPARMPTSEAEARSVAIEQMKSMARQLRQLKDRGLVKDEDWQDMRANFLSGNAEGGFSPEEVAAFTRILDGQEQP